MYWQFFITRISDDEQAYGYGQTVDEHVARGLSKADVQLPSVVNAHHLQIGESVHDEIDQRQNESQRMAFSYENDAEKTRRDARSEIGITSGLCAKAYNDGPFSGLAVSVAVTVVVDDEQTVSHKAAGHGRREDLPCERVKLYIIGDTHRNDAEKDDDENVAQSLLGQMGGIEEAEHDAHGSYQNHLQTAVEHEGKSAGAGQACSQGNGPFHGVHPDPSLGAGAARTESFPRRLYR